MSYAHNRIRFRFEITLSAMIVQSGYSATHPDYCTCRRRRTGHSSTPCAAPCELRVDCRNRLLRRKPERISKLIPAVGCLIQTAEN